MGCANGRTRISEVARLELFSRAAGFCQAPSCLRDLFIDVGSGRIHVGEMAHIIAAKKHGPRGTAELDLDDRASFDNVVLLCPTCHTMVDKAPLEFPVEEVRRWKDRHVTCVRAAVGAQTYGTRAGARDVIAPLFRQNRQIHLAYGPEAPGASTPESEMYRAWHRKVIESILPNSRRILAVLDANRHLLTEEETTTVERLRHHIDDLTARHVFDIREPHRARFPSGAETLLA